MREREGVESCGSRLGGEEGIRYGDGGGVRLGVVESTSGIDWIVGQLEKRIELRQIRDAVRTRVSHHSIAHPHRIPPPAYRSLVEFQACARFPIIARLVHAQ